MPEVYSRVYYHSPSVACQHTEVILQLFLLPSFRLDLPCADHHLSIGYEPWLCLARRKGILGEKEPTGKSSEMVKIPTLELVDKIGNFTMRSYSSTQPRKVG